MVAPLGLAKGAKAARVGDATRVVWRCRRRSDLANLHPRLFPYLADQATVFFHAARSAIAHWAQIREGYERSVVGLSLISR